MSRRLAVLYAVLAGLPLALSCASIPADSFVWVDEYVPPDFEAVEGVIAAGDTLDIRVLGQDQLSTRAPVRNDGSVTLPFLGDVQAAGLTPTALAAEAEERFKELINVPVVTVAVEEAPPSPISVLGEVGRPGRHAYETGMTMLEALAVAGGLTEFAHADRVFVLRGRPPVRIRFDTRRLLRGDGEGFSFVLRPGDTVIVE